MNQTPLQLGRSPVTFAIDFEGELEIAVDAHSEGEVSRWLTKEEGENLYDFLAQWLGKTTLGKGANDGT